MIMISRPSNTICVLVVVVFLFSILLLNSGYSTLTFRRTQNARENIELLKVTGKASATAESRSNIVRQLYNGSFLIRNENLCAEKGKDLQVLVAVESAPSYRSARRLARRTWLRAAKGRQAVAVVFMLAATLDAAKQDALRREQDEYGDLVQASFLDSYTNLTLKSVSIMAWADQYCPKARFILKVDDDAYVLVDNLLKFATHNADTQRTIFGFVAPQNMAIRDNSSRYFVPESEFPEDVFPPYAIGGAGYLVTRDIVRGMYQEALNQAFMRIEDVFMTGIVPKALGGVNLVNSPDFHYFLPTDEEFCCSARTAITLLDFSGDERLMYKWQAAIERPSNCSCGQLPSNTTGHEDVTVTSK